MSKDDDTRPNPEGMELYSKDVAIAGVYYRHEPCLRFVEGKKRRIELVADPMNCSDKNAIAVFGRFLEGSTKRRFHLGYLPRDEALRVASDGIMNSLKARLSHARVRRDDRLVIWIDLFLPFKTLPSHSNGNLNASQQVQGSTIDDERIVGRCYACLEPISILEDRIPPIEQSVSGTLTCDECETMNYFISLNGQDGITIGSERELHHQIEALRELIHLSNRKSKRPVGYDYEESGNRGGMPTNLHQTTCHYCGAEIAAQRGFAISVRSQTSGRTRQRVVCALCVGYVNRGAIPDTH